MIDRRAARNRRHRRIRKKLAGSTDRPRLTVFKSNRFIYAQIVDDDAGVTVAAASSAEAELRQRRLTTDTAAEVGRRLGERAGQAGVSAVVFDRGGYPFHGRVRALAEAVRETGLEF